MTMSLYEDACGDPRNVRTLALAAELAYLPEATGPTQFQDQMGMTARLISVGNTQCYVATNGDHVLAAFRGTEAPTSIEGLKDWLLTDAMNLLMVPEGRLGTDLAAAGVGARFHQGFVNAMAEIWEPLYGTVDSELKHRDRPLWLTGHSLGGALALLAGWLFHRRMTAVHQIYTFGGPMIGNAIAAQAINREFRGKVFRYVNGPDPIPRLPLVSLVASQYCHCDKEMVLQADDQPSNVALLQEAAGNAVDGILQSTVIDEIWGSINQRIAAHYMQSYRTALNAILS
jgi:predicted lipase